MKGLLNLMNLLSRINPFSQKAPMAVKPRNGVLLPLGQYKGYRDDLEPLLEEWGYKGLVILHGKTITVVNPNHKEPFEYLQGCPRRDDFMQAMGEKASIYLEELKQDALMIDTSNQDETVNLLRFVYMDVTVNKASDSDCRPLDKVSVKVNERSYLIHQFTYDVLKKSISTESPKPLSLLDAADHIFVQGEHGPYLLALINDLELLIKAGIPLLRVCNLRRNSEGVYTPYSHTKKNNTVKEKDSSSASSRGSNWFDFPDIFFWRSNSSRSGWFSSSNTSADSSSVSNGTSGELPRGGGGSSKGGGWGFLDFFDGFDF